MVLLAIFSCRRVNDQPNAEKPFVLFITDSTGEIRNYCFDRVYGLGNKNLNACCTPTRGIYLPLSITDSTSTFLFEKGREKDTLTITYTKYYSLGQREYTVFFRLKNVRSTFPNITMACIPAISLYCNTTYGLHAVVSL